MDLKTAFALAVAKNPHLEAIIEGDRRYTYEQWARRVWALGNGLRALGIGKGDRVLLGLKTREELSALLWALHIIGAVAVPYNPRSTLKTVSYYFRDSVARGIVFEEATAEVVGEMIQELSAPPLLISIDGPHGLEDVHDFEAIIGSSSDEEPSGEVDGSEVGLFLYTSGTTGEPKAVPLTHEMSLFRVLALLNHGLCFEEDLRIIGVMPGYHTIGVHAQPFLSVIFNGTYYPVSDFVPGQVIDLIAREKITYIFGSPTHFQVILNDKSFSKEKMASIKHALYAGAPMPTVLVQRCVEQITENFTHIYGNTETYCCGWYRHMGDRPQAARAGIWHNLRIIKVGGSINDLVDIGEEGELIVDLRSPEAFSGYWEKPEKTAEVCTDGWYHTGDAAKWLDEGVYQITGRVDDMIISGAENIHPPEVEDFLTRHPQVADVAVIGVPDERWGQVVKAFVVPRSPDLTAEELDAFCKNSRELEAWKRPRQYEFVDSIPYTPSGKIMRYILRQREEARSRELA